METEISKAFLKSFECPFCDTGILTTIVRKNYYHGRKSNCRKTRWKRCNHCSYNKLVGSVEKEKGQYNFKFKGSKNDKSTIHK